MGKYICIGSLKHNKKDYSFGDSVELNPNEAKPLIEGNVVQTEKDFRKAQALKNYIPPDISKLEDEIVALNETIKLLKAENGRLKARVSEFSNKKAPKEDEPGYKITTPATS